jgi:hypothetical protein
MDKMKLFPDQQSIGVCSSLVSRNYYHWSFNAEFRIKVSCDFPAYAIVVSGARQLPSLSRAF